MDNLIESLIKYEEFKIEDVPDNSSLSFSELRDDPGRVGLESVLYEISKLKTIKLLDLPNDLFMNISPRILKKYKMRVVSEDICELRRHPKPVRYTLLATFFWVRYREITDNLIELLIQIIHRIGVRAEKKVEKELINDFRRVNGKTNILFQMADAALSNPDGIIKQVLFPVVSEKTLADLVKEFKNTGSAYKQKVYTIMRASYCNHYRRMVPGILSTLEFRSNNEIYQPIIRALEIIKNYYNIGTHYFSHTEDIPIDGVIKPGMMDAVIEKDDKGQEHINRINYEIVTLQSLRDKLRCKEIWVEGADRYRNPDEDLPADFEERKEENYRALKQPLDSEELRMEIHACLNVVENWNSANSFIFYGKSGEISTNRIEDQELSVLSLHLLQNCLVYINTLMIQQVLSQKKWYDIMTTEDFRALTPLIYNHVNPYGNFDLDMEQRIPIDTYTI